MDVDLDFVKSVTLTDIYAYMTYLSRDRVQHQNSDVSDYGLNAASRSAKNRNNSVFLQLFGQLKRTFGHESLQGP